MLKNVETGNTSPCSIIFILELIFKDTKIKLLKIICIYFNYIKKS